MNKVSAGVTLTATWPHAVREPVDQYAGPIKEPEHLALCQGRKACLVSPQGAGFTALARPQIATAVPLSLESGRRYELRPDEETAALCQVRG